MHNRFLAMQKAALEAEKEEAKAKEVSVSTNFCPLIDNNKYHIVIWQIPVGTRGFKSRMCPPYPHACRKRRLKWGAVI